MRIALYDDLLLNLYHLEGVIKVKNVRVCSECKKWKRYSKGLCKYCYNKAYPKFLKRTALKRSTKPIKKISDSHSETLKLYKPLRADFLSKNPQCQLKLSSCTYHAVCVHHKKGKAYRELYLDVDFWMASCINCNNEVETLGEEAYTRGLKIRHNSIN